MKSLILRNCDAGGKSRKGFQWDTTIGGTTKATDWNPTPECGQGLHGWLWGEGNASVSSYNDSPIWLVCEIKEYVTIGSDKVKFPLAKTLFVGNMATAAQWLYDQLPSYGQPQDKKIIGLTGDYAFGGDLAHLVTKRNNVTQKAGYRSTQTAGEDSTQTAGYRSTQTAGNDSTEAPLLNYELTL